MLQLSSHKQKRYEIIGFLAGFLLHIFTKTQHIPADGVFVKEIPSRTERPHTNVETCGKLRKLCGKVLTALGKGCGICGENFGKR